MRYAAVRDDGTVAILSVVPVTVTDAGGIRYRVLRADSRQLLCEQILEPHQRRIITGEGRDRSVEVVRPLMKTLTIGVDVGDLEPNSIPGHTIEFADPKAAVAKWPEAARVVRVDRVASADVPKDRTLRNAWRRQGGAFSIDMPAARDIWRDAIWASSQRRLSELDRLHNRAVSQGRNDEAAKLDAERQQLRTVAANPAIERAATPEALKAIWPAQLPR